MIEAIIVITVVSAVTHLALSLYLLELKSKKDDLEESNEMLRNKCGTLEIKCGRLEGEVSSRSKKTKITAIEVRYKKIENQDEQYRASEVIIWGDLLVLVDVNGDGVAIIDADEVLSAEYIKEDD